MRGEIAHEAVATSNEVAFNAYTSTQLNEYIGIQACVSVCVHRVLYALIYTLCVFVKRRMTGIDVHIEDRLTGACVFEIEYLRSLTVCLIRTIIY